MSEWSLDEYVRCAQRAHSDVVEVQAQTELAVSQSRELLARAVFCILQKYSTRTARYASDMLESYRPTVLGGLNMVCLVPTIPTGSSLPKGCMLMIKKTDFGQSIIQMGKWLREGTTRMAKRWAIGNFGAAMARRRQVRTTPRLMCLKR